MSSNQQLMGKLKGLKTRDLISQYPDGTYPAQGSINYISNNTGNVAWSPSVTLDSSGNLYTNTVYLKDVSSSSHHYNPLTSVKDVLYFRGTAVGSGAGHSSQGAQGPQGVAGSQGNQGVAGSGSQGFTGSQGPQGAAGSGGSGSGSQGPQGNQGVAGSQGPQGTAGSQGFTGSQGVAGSQGPQGNQGAAGSGSQGPQGSAGVGSTWYTIPAGSDVSMNNFSLRDISSISFDNQLSFTSDTGTPVVSIGNSGSMSILSQTVDISFNVVGAYSFIVPQDVTTLYFEIIGAGGEGPTGGSGAYWKGFIDTRTMAGHGLQLGVGGTTNRADIVSAQATYIKDLSSSMVFIIAGAGGGWYQGTTTANVGGDAGVAGTLYFSSGNVPYYVCNGLPGGSTTDASGGFGGSITGGAGGATGLPATSGVNGSNPSLDASGMPQNVVAGGGSPSAITGLTEGEGGGGYAGGGQGGQNNGGLGGGGGGGSSFYRTDYVYLTVPPSAGSKLDPSVLPGYGRAEQSGFIGLSYTPTSITTQGDIVCNGEMNVGDVFYVSNSSFVDMYGGANTTKVASGINMYTDTAQLRLYAQVNPSTSIREGTIGIASPAELGGGWMAPTLTFDSSQNSMKFTPHAAGGLMIYDNSGNLTVGDALIVDSTNYTMSLNGNPVNFGSTLNLRTKDNSKLKMYGGYDNGGAKGVIGFADYGGGWLSPYTTYDGSNNAITFTPSNGANSMTYDSLGNLTVNGTVTATEVIVGIATAGNIVCGEVIVDFSFNGTDGVGTFTGVFDIGVSPPTGTARWFVTITPSSATSVGATALPYYIQPASPSSFNIIAITTNAGGTNMQWSFYYTAIAR